VICLFSKQSGDNKQRTVSKKTRENFFIITSLEAYLDLRNKNREKGLQNREKISHHWV